ncbi:MAG: SecE/Sec61-gamma subunit of protein translocation complex [Verrucomicrobiota bacterium]|jgi:preprotein translocase subunit SecE
MNNDYIKIAVWAGVIAVVFGCLWATGNLVRLRNYVLETREELRKCTWPTADELKGSTVVVAISILLLGLYTIGIDFFLVHIVRWMSSL